MGQQNLIIARDIISWSIQQLWKKILEDEILPVSRPVTGNLNEDILIYVQHSNAVHDDF